MIGMEFSIISNVILEYLSFLAQKCNLFSKHVFKTLQCVFSILMNVYLVSEHGWRIVLGGADLKLFLYFIILLNCFLSVALETV